MSRERRRSPRVEMLGRLHGHVVSLGVPVIVREMSLGGLSMETTFAFPVGAIHEFRLKLGDGATVQLRGKVVYSRETPRPDGPSAYVSGVQFIDDEPSDGTATVDEILDRLK
jgi:PilZ domain